MNKKVFCAITGILTCGVVLGLSLNAKKGLIFIKGQDKPYNHYSAVAATCEDYGIREYWTNCSGTTTIYDPGEVQIVEMGQPSAADILYIVNNYGTSDERLIAPTGHDYQNSIVTEKIGYFESKCSVCGDSNGLSSDLMLFADIDFTQAQYSAHGGKWDTNVQPTAKTMTYEVTDGSVENEIFLPKINFSLYKTVSFTLSGNDWSARVGLQTGSYAFPYAYKAEPYSGTLSFITNGNQVNATLSCAEGTTQNLTITDSDILNGNKSVSLFMIADAAYRTITAELTALTDSCNHNFVADTNCIGKEVCSVCGEARGVAPTIDFATNGIYGMYDWYKSFGAPDPGWVFSVGTNSMHFYTYNAGVISEVCLPRIYFAGFEAITIDLTIANASEKYSFESDMSVIFTVPSASYATKLVFSNLSASSMTATLRDSSNNILLTKVITDANVLNGVDGFKFYDEGVGLGDEILSNYTFIGTHAHNYVADTSCIGKEVCSLCYAEHGATNPTFDFTANLFGAYDCYDPWGPTVAQDGWARADNAGQISFANYTAGDICRFHLPRMYFAGFSSVSIDVVVNYTDVVYALDSDFTSSYTTPFAGYSLKVVFENITSSSMDVKILDAFGTTQVQATCSDSNALNGLEGFVIYTKGSGNVGWDAFSNFTFIA